MEQQMINFGSILGKDILNIGDGSFVGTVQGMLIDEKERKVIGIILKNKSRLSNKAKSVIAFGQIKSLTGDLVTVIDSGEVALEGKNIIGLSVITADGVFLGKTVDFTFAKDGRICEYILKDGVMKGLPNDRGALNDDDILTIGKEAIIAREGLTQGEFAITDEDIYGDWEKVDEILADISDEENTEEKKTKSDGSYEEHFDEVTEKIGKAFSEAGEKIKNIDTDKMRSKLKMHANKLSEGFFGLCAEIKGYSKYHKYDKEAAKAEEMQAEKAHEPHNTEIDFADLAKQFAGKIVYGHLTDDEGNILASYGQEISAEMLKNSEKAGKLDELLELIKSEQLKDKTIVMQKAEETLEKTAEEEPVEITSPNNETVSEASEDLQKPENEEK